MPGQPSSLAKSTYDNPVLGVQLYKTVNSTTVSSTSEPELEKPIDERDEFPRTTLDSNALSSSLPSGEMTCNLQYERLLLLQSEGRVVCRESTV